MYPGQGSLIVCTFSMTLILSATLLSIVAVCCFYATILSFFCVLDFNLNQDLVA